MWHLSKYKVVQIEKNLFLLKIGLIAIPEMLLILYIGPEMPDWEMKTVEFIYSCLFIVRILNAHLLSLTKNFLWLNNEG